MKQNDKILFESKRTLNVRYILIFIGMLLSLVNILSIKSISYSNEDRIRNLIEGGYKVHNISDAQNYIEKIPDFFFIFGVLLLVLLLILALVKLYKLQNEVFYLTEKGFTFKTIGKQEFISFDKIEKIVIFEKIRISKIFYNSSENVILLKFNSTRPDKNIANQGAFENICDLLVLLKENHSDKLVINPISVNSSNKIIGLVINMVFAAYIIIKGFDGGINKNFGIFGGIIILLYAVSSFIIKEQNECDTLYKTNILSQ